MWTPHAAKRSCVHPYTLPLLSSLPDKHRPCQLPLRSKLLIKGKEGIRVTLVCTCTRQPVSTLRAAGARAEADVAAEMRVTFQNKRGETLVGKLVDTGSKGAVILCHGLSSHKDGFHLPAIAQALQEKGVSSLRIDFSGNGESEGVFHYANIKGEADDIQAAVDYLRSQQKQTIGLLGHSKGGSSVLMHAAEHGSIARVVNVSGRFEHKQGLEERFGNDVFEKVKQGGGLECTSKSAVRGTFKWTFTEQDLEERMQLDMAAVCAHIDPTVAVLTIHGSDDERIPVADSRRYAAQLPGSCLHIVEGANHNFSAKEHNTELIEKAVEFLTADPSDAPMPSAAGHGGMADVDDRLAAAAIAESPCSTQGEKHPAKHEEHVTFTNGDGLQLVGTLVDTGSEEVVILCHGMADNRNAFHFPALADTLSQTGISSFRFDFRGNGDSQGTFKFGNMKEEAEDIRAAVTFLQRKRRKLVKGLLGHSKAGCGVLIYSATYGDIPFVVNVAGRFDCKTGITMRFGDDIFDRLELDGSVEVGWNTASGPREWILTKEDMDARLATDIAAECQRIPKDVSVLTIHGTDDKAIPLADGQSIANRVPGNKIHIIENADHSFTNAQHAAEMVQAAVSFFLDGLARR